MTFEPPFRRVLVANRGEIAVRICRSLKEMGIETVAVHSEIDPDAAHVLAASIAHNLGGHDASSSYLQVPQLLDAGCINECDAVHPGYGFLSEDPDFCRALEAVGMRLIGPEPESMEILGSKQKAKEAAIAADVPVVPGCNQDSGDDGQMLEEARKIGFPILIKASAGGGGKGMRLVAAEADFLEEMAACRRESQSAFHSSEMLLERYVEPARHIEIQIIGDSHGNVIALNERECSIQRRHQKVIEEAPSPAVSPDLRQHMSEAAVRLAKHVGYQNAGTVEFLLDDEGHFYFMEMNTRLQVEHPVTEMTTGLDLVQLQVLIAGGAAIPDLLEGREFSPRGHSIEVRVYAESPEQGYLPAAGRLTRVIEPAGPGIRVDSGVFEDCEISVHFDPMLSKIIVHAPSRDSACRKMAQALKDTVYLGVPTNVDFLARVSDSPQFRAGQLSTGFLGEHPELAAGPVGGIPDLAYAAAALCRSIIPGNSGSSQANATTADGSAEVWDEIDNLRIWDQS
ncbi:MAG: biotin carboxylase N-terminal domain-containing protein [Planctomycetota bacterium]|nr:biotin carboxylase N-terminal domain-containing protein [Planctomycetota bacterium]